ncbi:MAG: hypothetical protein IPM29_32820 [Planctomycetes bacterium]|nr:hypothetical protein [Planctomycetota bacterium]
MTASSPFFVNLPSSRTEGRALSRRRSFQQSDAHSPARNAVVSTNQ